MGPTGCPRMLVTNYQSTLHKIPEERRYYYSTSFGMLQYTPPINLTHICWSWFQRQQNNLPVYSVPACHCVPTGHFQHSALLWVVFTVSSEHLRSILCPPKLPSISFTNRTPEHKTRNHTHTSRNVACNELQKWYAESPNFLCSPANVTVWSPADSTTDNTPSSRYSTLGMKTFVSACTNSCGQCFIFTHSLWN